MNGYQAPLLSRVNKILLIILGTLFVVQTAAIASGAFSLKVLLGLIPSAVFPWRFYTLFTYPWVEDSLLGIIFNGLILWFLGSELERQWGEKLYLKFLLTCVVGGGLLFTGLAALFPLGGILVGPAGLTYAMCVAYAVLFPDRHFMLMFAFPVKAMVFCLIMAGMELYMGLVSGNPASFGHLLSMGLAFVLIRFQTFGPIRWWLKGPGPKTKSKAGSGKLKLVKDDDKPPYWH